MQSGSHLTATTVELGYLSPQIPAMGIPSSLYTKETRTNIFEKAKLLANMYQGECISNQFSICKGKNSLKFKCLNNHIFFLSADSIEQSEIVNVVKGTKRVIGAASSHTTSANNEWCYKCKKFFENCKEVAARVGISVVEGLYQPKITLQCAKKNHVFKISYSKKLHTLSCSECRREEREEWKEQLKQEEQRRNEYY